MVSNVRQMVSIGTINGENSDIKYDLLAYFCFVWKIICNFAA